MLITDSKRLLSARLLGLALVLCGQAQVSVQFDLFEKLNGALHLKRTVDGDHLGPTDYVLQELLPPLLKQRPFNENGTRVEYKEYNLKDTSNDDAKRLTGQELIARSGFQYKVYEAVADDGYITQVTHLINPRADQTRLRRPPVLMEHGGTIDPTAYLVASSIQHFPEKWPREPGDPPTRSWNRSLAFTLANNGYDVWLAETRGSNEQNKRHIKTKALDSLLKGKDAGKNQTAGEKAEEVSHQWDYWAFSLDDIIAHELKSHMDLVLKQTNSKRLHLMTYSLSTPTSLAFLGMRPDYAKRVKGYISMAPIISGEGVNSVVKMIFQVMCPLIPNKLGTMLITDGLLTQKTRELNLLLFNSKAMRYSVLKALMGYSMGSSGKWATLLDLNVVGHLLRPLSFKQMRQFCQQTRSNKLQKFDFGPVKNQAVYKQPEPPEYKIDDLKIRDWIVVSADNDLLSTPQVYEHLYKAVNPKPIAHVVAPNYHHLDLVIGWENDRWVNLPIMRYLDKMSYPADEQGAGRGDFMETAYDDEPASPSARTLEVLKVLPPEAAVVSASVPIHRRARQVQQFDLGEFIQSLSKNVERMLESLTSGAKGLDLLSTASKTLTNVAEPLKNLSAPLAQSSSSKSTAAANPIAPLVKNVPIFGDALENFSQILQPEKLFKSLGLGSNSGSGAADSANPLNNVLGPLTNLLPKQNK